MVVVITGRHDVRLPRRAAAHARGRPRRDHQSGQRPGRPQRAADVDLLRGQSAIVRAADRPKRDVHVGAMSKILSLAERFSPALLDRYMLFRNKMVRDQLSDRADRGESNLFASANETRIHGDFRRLPLLRRRRPARG